MRQMIETVHSSRDQTKRFDTISWVLYNGPTIDTLSFRTYQNAFKRYQASISLEQFSSIKHESNCVKVLSEYLRENST